MTIENANSFLTARRVRSADTYKTWTVLDNSIYGGIVQVALKSEHPLPRKVLSSAHSSELDRCRISISRVGGPNVASTRYCKS